MSFVNTPKLPNTKIKNEEFWIFNWNCNIFRKYTATLFFGIFRYYTIFYLPDKLFFFLNFLHFPSHNLWIFHIPKFLTCFKMIQELSEFTKDKFTLTKTFQKMNCTCFFSPDFSHKWNMNSICLSSFCCWKNTQNNLLHLRESRFAFVLLECEGGK